MPFDKSELTKLAADLQTNTRRIGKDVAAVVRKSTRRVGDAAAGAAPSRTGELRNSRQVRFTGSGNSGLMSGEVSFTSAHAAFVENGTARMPPEPFLGPSLEAERDAFVESIAHAASKALG